MDNNLTILQMLLDISHGLSLLVKVIALYNNRDGDTDVCSAFERWSLGLK